MLNFKALIAACALIAFAACGLAAGGADYGRGPETDPLGTAAAAAAQSTADAASASASAAQSTADAASASASAAQSTADAASASAAAAQSTADAVSAVAATALQPADVWGPPGVTTSTVAAVATAAIQTKDLSGGSLVGYRVIHVWLSDTSMGAAGTNNITSLVLSGGTAVATVTAKCDYWYLTGSAGTASAAVTGEAQIDKYIMVADGAAVTAAKITFEP